MYVIDWAARLSTLFLLAFAVPSVLFADTLGAFIFSCFILFVTSIGTVFVWRLTRE